MLKEINKFRRAPRIIKKGVNQLYSRFSDPNFPAIKRAKGPYLYDFDENRYVDFYMGGGNLLMGHIVPQVTKVVKGWYNRGYAGGYPFVQSSQMLSNRIVKLFSYYSDSVVDGSFIFFDSSEEAYAGLKRILSIAGCKEIKIISDRGREKNKQQPLESHSMTEDTVNIEFSDTLMGKKSDGQNITSLMFKLSGWDSSGVRKSIAYAKESERRIIISDERSFTAFSNMSGDIELLKMVDIRLFGSWLTGGLNFGALYIGKGIDLSEVSSINFRTYAAMFKFPPLYKIKAAVKFLETFFKKGGIKRIYNLQESFYRILNREDFLFIRGFIYINPERIKDYNSYWYKMLKYGIYMPYTLNSPVFVSMAHDEQLLGRIVKELLKINDF